MKPDFILTKPLLRGYFHQEAFFVSCGACALLVAKSTTRTTLIASLVYSFGLLMLFGVSAVYHRFHWQPKIRSVLKRLDHSAIFILIAGTFTPICLLALSVETGRWLLLVVWIATFFGILQSIFWVGAPKWLTAIFYVFVGWLVVPYLRELSRSLGTTNLIFLGVGGLVYTVGAVFYAIKKPNLFPQVFGYHELFHIFTVVGAAFHFVVIFYLVTS